VSSRLAPQELLPWALSVLGLSATHAPPALTVVAGDASHRRYFRAELSSQSHILVEAPPSTEKNEAFVSIAALLTDVGVKVPTVLGVDFDRGFLLLEDLGDRLLLPLLEAESAGARYDQAFGVLLKMTAVNTPRAGLGYYDKALLQEELNRFTQWFLKELLGHTLTAKEQAMLERLFARLIDSALEQPLVLVHRDFHSRNLMLAADDELAVIDFQDAVVGPITYDLVSLLRDCYIQWPVEQVQAWALSYRDLLRLQGLAVDLDDITFLRWFDWMGLQRHLKVLGTFARLYLRDGKSGYLDDLPRVIHYVLEVTTRYADQEPAFAEFTAWFSECVAPLIAQQAWSKTQ